MDRSETIGEVAKALAKAQGKMSVAVKDRKNEHFRSSYATLASVLDAVRGPLSAEGLAVVQSPGMDADGHVVVSTTILHGSGEWVSSELRARPQKSDPQGIGSAVTYLRRYGLMAMCGIAPDDDDDGNAAAMAPTPKTPKPDPDPIDAKGHRASFATDRARFCARLKDLGTTYEEVAEMCESLGRPRPSAMTQGQRDGLAAWLDEAAGKEKLETYQHEVAERAAIQGEGQ